MRIEARPCDRPTRDVGIGVVVGEDLIAMAAHTVDGPRREITVGGAPATVVAIDLRRDLALLSAPTFADAADLRTGAVLGDARVLVTAEAANIEVRIVATGPLIVENVSDDTRYEREVHTFEPGVAEGTSGAPLVDDNRDVLGIVLLDRGDQDTAYAVTASELAGLLAEHRDGAADVVPDDPAGCPD